MMTEWPSLYIFSTVSDGGWTYTGTGKFGPVTKLGQSKKSEEACFTHRPGKDIFFF